MASALDINADENNVAGIWLARIPDGESMTALFGKTNPR
jgi:hypothetical protein